MTPQESYDLLLAKQGFVWDHQWWRIKMDYFSNKMREALCAAAEEAIHQETQEKAN